MGRDRSSCSAPFLAVACLLVCVSESPAAPPPSHVKATATADKDAPPGKRIITLTLDIDNGWIVFANPVGPPDLRFARTLVTVKSKPGIKDVRVSYPRGRLVKDALLGDYRIYEGRVTIRITADVKDPTKPIELLLKCHPFSEAMGALPQRIRLRVP